MNVTEIIWENEKRLAIINKQLRKYNPLTGEESNSVPREKAEFIDFPNGMRTLYLPSDMIEERPFIRDLIKYGIKGYIINELRQQYSNDLYEEVYKLFIKVRIKYDFEFWASSFVMIKGKNEQDDVCFVLNRAQRRFLSRLESQRRTGVPIRIILLKARQWGGSTLVQIYFAWIQLVHCQNWNSIICAHLKETTSEIRGMYEKLLEFYPSWLLNSEQQVKLVPFSKSANISYIKETKCKIKVGSAEAPESARGADSSMAHCTEVAFWKATKMKTPQQLIRAVCGGIGRVPLSIIVYESTANGTGNYFYLEYKRAKNGKSDKEAVFVPWFEIDMYSEPIEDYKVFIGEMSEYEWELWKLGATLEAIAWYREKRKEYDEHADMMAEYPSTEEEAFQSTGSKVFDNKYINELEKDCKKPKFIGEIYGKGLIGKDALKELKFSVEAGCLSVWELPDTNLRVSNRYVVCVDIGGRSDKADYSVIAVFDRFWMMTPGGVPEIVAEWYGHIDHDILAWKSVQIAKFYNNALLVIESNTLETEATDGDHCEFILDTIADAYTYLYSRTPADKVKEGVPIRYGFHMNRSTKTLVVDHQVRMLREKGYKERDIQTLEEHRVFEKKPNGSFGAKDGCHDDKFITRATGNYICYSLPLPYIIKETKSANKQNKIVSEASFN